MPGRRQVCIEKTVGDWDEWIGVCDAHDCEGVSSLSSLNRIIAPFTAGARPSTNGEIEGDPCIHEHCSLFNNKYAVQVKLVGVVVIREFRFMIANLFDLDV